MPPTTVHVNGSVNFEDAEAVMRGLATRIPQLRRIPDGETGERREWLAFQSEKFQTADGLESVPTDPAAIGELAGDTVRLATGTQPEDIAWPDLGFAAFYADSWGVFHRLQAEGVIASDVRFQVQYPSPLACVGTYVDPADAPRVLRSYERALLSDLDKLLAVVPHEQIAVQWDLPFELGVLEMPEVFAISADQDLAAVAEAVARCIDHVPAEVPTGLHLCYGDYMHRHWKEPDSLDAQVRLLNAIAGAATRDISWCAFTVPQYVREPAYFAPLADLKPSGTELYLGLVPYHPADQAPGTTEEQVRLIDALLEGRPWGVCTECGLVNVEREELPGLLNLHSELLERLASRAIS